ncbi:hypothetical protein J8J14_21690 [Roseomonas sp. SSH11]|uniref:Uncharacterized protein n=1 Tax=Pararoseomonas baculiformis TaxID=2820812 RepID=A0ABS4AMD4_9PROT|nr:hypothetical protein [Pararoseomonas baculiformis]MBP0447384.1 hypothetical protein [Pararoseomonas baculiformis]
MSDAEAITDGLLFLPKPMMEFRAEDAGIRMCAAPEVHLQLLDDRVEPAALNADVQLAELDEPFLEEDIEGSSGGKGEPGGEKRKGVVAQTLQVGLHEQGIGTG